MYKFATHIILALVIYGAFYACQKENNPPVIQSFTAEPDSVYPGDTVTLSYTANDEDSDGLMRAWSCTAGVFLTTDLEWGSPVQWVAPKNPDNHFITVEINDLVNFVKDSVLIHVKDTMGAFIDPRDNHEYKWVKIGSQAWMAENLAYLPLVNLIQDTSYTEPRYNIHGFEGVGLSDAKATYEFQTYGVLYNWVAANSECPSGWHLPSDEEWKTLEIYLGMSIEDANFYEQRTSGDVGKKLKSTNGWFNEGNGTNSSKFNALPGGSTDAYPYYYPKKYARFWTSTIITTLPNLSWERDLVYSRGWVSRLGEPHYEGYSVRCIKDE
ncbi:MAG: FISUMP domain-containing protein [Bacteroidota bacterium]|nr:FISUMP domain-containing protein [Bacteroidota bacterium]